MLSREPRSLRPRLLRRLGRGLRPGVGLGIALTIVAPSAVTAHDSGSAGSLEIVFGWEQEPTYAGFPNAVHVTVLDTDGAPVDDPSAQLTVTLEYGGLALTRPLVPLADPGEYGAVVVPTEPGTYSFHVMGTIAGETVDLTSTCSDTTFHCVVDPVEVMFPGNGASPAGDAASPVVAAAPHDGGGPDLVAIVAIVLAAIACIGVGLIGIGAWRPPRP